MKLNLGCGSTKLTDVVNVDMSDEVNPDMKFDIRGKFPFENDSVDEVYLFHTIEHIEKRYHSGLFLEINRVLKTGGILLVSYPEFGRILQNWLDNKSGKREFWEATIYGRQLYPGDYHVAAIDKIYLSLKLTEFSFIVEKMLPETGDDFNTIICAVKAGKPEIGYEELVHKEIFA